MKSQNTENNKEEELDLENSEKEPPKEGVANLNEEIKKLQEKNLELSQKILASTLYIKRYVKNVRIFAAIKWGFIVLIVIFGFLSFPFVLDYLQETISAYQDQVNQIVETTNNTIR